MTAPLLLHVEDDDAHATLTRLALEATTPTCEIVRCRDGVDALGWLHDVERLPDLVLLDLNLPRIDGLGVLETMKGDGRMRLVPVVVMTTSTNPQDREQALARYANNVMTKPLDLDEFNASIELLCAYWFRVEAA
ncbi:MAG: response regulator [Phycisphaerales bacterium]|nr:response regulator [Phycisphaerales bacterium]